MLPWRPFSALNSLNAIDLLSDLQGEVVVDLGSGGGLDCFLAAQKGALCHHGPSHADSGTTSLLTIY